MKKSDLKIKVNWIRQDTLFGLDYSTAKAKFWNYEFDIRYDANLGNESNIRPTKCNLVLFIRYRGQVVYICYNAKLQNLVVRAMNWTKEEIFSLKKTIEENERTI